LNTSFIDFSIIKLPDSSGTHLLAGQNRKGVLLVANWEDNAELRSFIDKVLASVKISIEQDTLYINITTTAPLSFPAIVNGHDIKYVLLFGYPPQNLGLNFILPLYTPVRLNGITFLAADAVRQIYEERQKGGKKMAGALWKSLKAIFLSE
jgi:hypothetical protein